jgi:exopolysaccharide biosynthesis polyprenyl glycosylphosphotransferase
LIVDVIVLYMASSAALLGSTSVRSVTANHWLAAGFPLLVLATLRVTRAADERLRASLLDACMHVVGVVSFAALLTAGLDSMIAGNHPIDLAFRLWLFAAVYLGLARAVLLSIRRQAMRAQSLATPTLIVGAGIVGEHLVRRLVRDPTYGLRPVGFVDSDPRPRGASPSIGDPSVPVLGGSDDIASVIEMTGARHVILAFSTEPDHVLVEKIKECQRQDVAVSVVPRFFEWINERAMLDHVGGMPLVALRPVDPRGWQFAVKHAIDRSVALLVLLLLSPTLLAIAVAVRLSSRGPVLFRQRRVGRDGRVFDLLKFRTMHELPDHDAFAPPGGNAPGGIEGRDRRTRLGRFLRGFSLDELPQFINVLRGDMSIVGPRPERPHYVEQFRAEIARYEDRHRVKSGITGWAQVHGLRGQTSIADRVEWDNFYIQNWSLRIDLRIMAMTIVEVLRYRSDA